MHYLMIKKSMNTNIFYLCKSSSLKVNKDKMYLYFYKGSGKRWVKHIEKHNSWIVTCVIGEYDTKKDLIEAGIFYSKKFNVVESEDWANLIEEKGDGGITHSQLGKTWKVTEAGKENMKMSRRFSKFINPNLWEHNQEIRRLSTLGEKNWQFKGRYITPWGTFASLRDASIFAKKHKKTYNTVVVTNIDTIKKYCTTHNDIFLVGRRVPLTWRNKTPAELGFSFEEVKNGSI